MVDKDSEVLDAPEEGAPAPAAPRRGPGHRGDMRDTMAEMAERAQMISQEAGSKIAGAMKDVIAAAAGFAGFAIESARDVVQYMVRRGQMTQEEADRLIRMAEEAHGKRPDSEKQRPTQSKIDNDRKAAEKAEAARLALLNPPPPPVRGAAFRTAPSSRSVPPKPAAPAPASAPAAAPAKAAPAKSAPAPAAKPAAKAPAKPAAKAPAPAKAARAPAKTPAKAATKAPARAPAKPAAKLPAKGAAKKAPARGPARAASKPAAKAPAKKPAAKKK